MKFVPILMRMDTARVTRITKGSSQAWEVSSSTSSTIATEMIMTSGISSATLCWISSISAAAPPTAYSPASGNRPRSSSARAEASHSRSVAVTSVHVFPSASRTSVSGSCVAIRISSRLFSVSSTEERSSSERPENISRSCSAEPNSASMTFRARRVMVFSERYRVRS